MADEIQRVSESVAALKVKISMFKQCLNLLTTGILNEVVSVSSEGKPCDGPSG